MGQYLYSYGPKNDLVNRLNFYRDYTGVRGYPSDKQYMKDVRGAANESTGNYLRESGYRALRKAIRKTKKRSGARTSTKQQKKKSTRRASGKR